MRTSAFDANQTDSAYPPGIEYLYWTKARNRIIWREILRSGMHKGRVLEIGCGRGIVVKYLRQRGIDCHGADICNIQLKDETLAEYVHTSTSAFDLPADFRASVSSILLLDVLEHLDDPLAFMSQIRQSYPAAKLWLVTVPARQEFWAEYDEFYGHKKRYDIPDMKSLIAGFGGALLRCGYFFHSLYLPMIALKLAGVQRKIRLTAPPAALRWAHSILAGVFMLDYYCIPSRVPGTSLLGLFRLDK